MFVDSHCHILKNYYENIDLVLKNAENISNDNKQK